MNLSGKTNMSVFVPMRWAVLATALLAAPAFAAPPPDLDARVEAAMREHGVPGMAIAIVENGKPVLAKG